MNAYRYEADGLCPQASLWAAVHLPMKEHMVLSLVGAGGKTTVMYRLADELAAMGKRVIITTSTHIYVPKNREILLSETAAGVGGVCAPGIVLVTGIPSGNDKLKGMAAAELEKLADYADVLLIEADGAKMLPLKVPAEKEPVLIPGTTAVIACAGLDSIGQTLKAACFRPELAGALLETDSDHVICSGDLAAILTHSRGLRKGVNDTCYRMILNKADDSSRQKQSLEVIHAMDQCWRDGCIVTSFAI